MKNKRLMKVSGWTHKELWAIKCDLEKIEGKKLSMNEVIERILRGKDIPMRLRQGSMERKYGFR